MKQLAKRKSPPGGERPIEEIRLALLDIGWEAYSFVSRCLGCQMRAFANALPNPLGSLERDIFDQMHLPQAHLGGLPLILLADRFDFCWVAIRDVVENPGDRVKISILHRMLDYYADLVRARRKADNTPKVPIHSLDPKRDSMTTARTATPNLLVLPTEIATRLAQANGVRCSCPSRDDAAWSGGICRDEDDLDGAALVYTGRLICNNCGYCTETDIYASELSAMMSQDES